MTEIIKLRPKRRDLERVVAAIKATVYLEAKDLTVTEAIGAIELAKLEILEDQRGNA